MADSIISDLDDLKTYAGIYSRKKQNEGDDERKILGSLVLCSTKKCILQVENLDDLKAVAEILTVL